MSAGLDIAQNVTGGITCLASIICCIFLIKYGFDQNTTYAYIACVVFSIINQIITSQNKPE